MNEPIATITTEHNDRSHVDSLNVVRSPHTNNFGFWVERQDPISKEIEMSSVTWITKAQALDLSIALQKETA